MVHLHLGCLFPRQELTKLTPQLCALRTTSQSQYPTPSLYPQPRSGTAKMHPPLSLSPAGAAVSVPAAAAAKLCRGSRGDTGAALGQGSGLGLSCRTPSAAPAGFQLLAKQSGTRPPAPRRRLVVPRGDINTCSAAAHLVPEMSLGTSNKKLN